jgi:hypothetical protein
MRSEIELGGRVSEQRPGDEYRTHFRRFQLRSGHLAPLGVALTLHGVLLDVLPCRRIVGIAVVVVIAHVVHTGDTCTSAEVLRRTEITLPVELRERVDSEIYYYC